MMLPALLPLYQTSDEQIRRFVKLWRRRLNYNEREVQWEESDWEPPEWLTKALDGIGRFFSDLSDWIFREGGWKILAPCAAALLLFLFYLGVRNVRVKRKVTLNGADEKGRPAADEVLVENETGAEWLRRMEEARLREDYGLAVVALYRAVLAGILERTSLFEELSNREIARLVSGGERTFFQELYRASDSVVFGGAELGRHQFDRLLNSYREVRA
ncbi:MAG: hypothetical protein PQJ60_07570 [Spirochaetales bacterium]|nr:hypothetical protein [Spirochaetales bacterium]